MKIINRYVAMLAIGAMMFTSCSKDESTTAIDDSEFQSVDITFGASLNDLVNRASQQLTKDHFNTIPECSDAEPAVARIDFSYGGSSYQVDVAILSDETGYFTDYSEGLKIPVANNSSVTVSLDGFMVYDGDPDAGGNLIWVAPKESDGDFDGYVDQALPFNFQIADGTKPYIPVEVLCFDRRMVNEYGYVFFDILPEVIYPLCLFVNYCDVNGRHFVADYSIDLYFGTDANGIQLYDHNTAGAMATTGDYGDGEYYADPLCLVVPGPPANLDSDQPYLYMVLYPQDWAGTGDIDNSPIRGIQLSWDMVGDLLNGDGTTNEYYHLLIGECDDALTGDGSGGGTGNNDLDGDGVTNDIDQCANTPAGATVNAVGCPDTDGDGVYDNEDDCDGTPAGTAVDANGCSEAEECTEDIDLDGICDDVDGDITCIEASVGSSATINLDSGAVPTISMFEEGEVISTATMVYAQSNTDPELLVTIGLEGVAGLADISEVYVMISQGANSSSAGGVRGSYGDVEDLVLDLTGFDTSADISVEAYVIYCDE